MNTTQLARNGMLISDQGNEVARPLSALAGKVRLETGYTLRSFLKMMHRYPEFQDISVFIPPLVEECGQCREIGCVSDMLTHLEFIKKVEMVGFPGEPRFNVLCTLIGFHNETRQDLRLFQFNTLLDVPIRLGMLKHTVFGDSVNIMKFETDFSLFEFIEGIAWEFGFQRFPEHCSIKG
ncbi:hypothetical protein [Pseudodesulfovibrio piezophilus]|uniref:Uncharacterized protein n=1 Tax=Pseudodesulfovibrio piezophilus (strain DSM 21447 / JCM 15486 / C1TLV30) TaxID=1322246 RepID=M1WJN0_PSEP2|nr:hypothetical protein [Pseudodesulfovibrio piezophilus]CCH48181.1 conserved protein of unknown function [Pseudodesulfovibrio piezophilus C1TLV30]